MTMNPKIINFNTKYQSQKHTNWKHPLNPKPHQAIFGCSHYVM